MLSRVMRGGAGFSDANRDKAKATTAPLESRQPLNQQPPARMWGFVNNDSAQRSLAM